MDVEAFRQTPESLKNDGKYPCIIHWNMNHFVVLNGFKGDKIDEHVGDEVWDQAKPAFEWLNVDSYEDGSYDNKIHLSLYYSDGAQKTIKIDKKTAEIIEPYLKKLSQDYMDNK